MSTMERQTPPQAHTLDTWRCSGCRRILARLTIQPGSVVEVKCKCGTVNTLHVAARYEG